MTIFPKGRNLSADEIRAIYPNKIKPLAIQQLLERWPVISQIQTPRKLWGDEMEWMLVRFKHDERRVVAPIDLEPLRDRAITEGTHVAIWSTEVGRFQIETCPPAPYTEAFNDLLLLEKNLNAQQDFFRHKYFQATKTDDLLMLAQLPINGCPNYTDPNSDGPSQPNAFPYPSIFTNTNLILSSHQVYKRSTSNFIERSGGQKYVRVPVFFDDNTPQPFMENLAERYGGLDRTEIVREKQIPNHIVMEGVGMGLTSCAMQVTQQLTDREEACYVYDQLASVSPLFIALTAAAPFCRGYLTAWDSRWEIFSHTSDHRTPEQRRNPDSALKKANAQTEDEDMKQPVAYTRVHSIEMYTSDDSKRFHDIPQAVDNKLLSQLKTSGVSDLFARYIAQYFIMEPIALAEGDIENQSSKNNGLFTSIQDFTNWTVVRLKFPILKQDTEAVPEMLNSSDDNVVAGWRVEFRPMGAQANAFQCSAFLVFIVLLTRALLRYRIDLRVPISLLEQNVNEAVKVNAYRVAKFWCRKLATLSDDSGDAEASDQSLVQLTAAEMMCGKAGEFHGLIPLVEHYMENIHDGDNIMSQETKDHIGKYLKFLRARAKGEEKTVADWMRSFVRAHPDYKKDSYVPPQIMYDMMLEYQKFQPA